MPVALRASSPGEYPMSDALLVAALFLWLVLVGLWLEDERNYP